MRIGHGYDVHRLVQGGKLILGGVDIPFELGLLGHSDADVLVHAVIDSLLGAVAMGDIGTIFPDDDTNLKGISSLKLLASVADLYKQKEIKIVNIDATIVAQYPKLLPYVMSMRTNLATVLDLNIAYVSIKATTEEGLGFTGMSEGISAFSMCLVESNL
jgi:2-C-methyl-D-erythritol 2,4-cyclodiphosphate synthase